jgi:membrane protease YdiL (CAAX protease family)
MRRPLAALALLVIWLLVNALVGGPGPAPTSLQDAVTRAILPQPAAAAVALGLAALLLRWRGLGFRRPRPGTWRLLWLPGLYLLLTAALIAVTGPPPAGLVALILTNMLLVGLSEELMFRGFLYSGLRDRLALWPAALVTSVLFGAVHVLNAAVTGHLRLALLQCVSAAMLGLLLLGLRLRMGSIWPVILLHAFWNTGLLVLGRNATPPLPGEPLPIAAQIAPILFLLPLGLYGLRLLRDVTREEGPRPTLPPDLPPGPAPRNPWAPPS